jgi:hypothetical protein
MDAAPQAADDHIDFDFFFRRTPAHLKKLKRIAGRHHGVVSSLPDVIKSKKRRTWRNSG